MLTRSIRHVTFSQSIYVFYFILKITILRSLLLVVPLVSALNISIPTFVTIGGTLDISWATTQGDPSSTKHYSNLFALLTVFLAPYGPSD